MEFTIYRLPNSRRSQAVLSGMAEHNSQAAGADTLTVHALSETELAAFSAFILYL